MSVIFYPFSSSSEGPVANATDVLQPSMLIVLTLSGGIGGACFDIPTFAARYPHVHDARDPSSKRWNYVGEN